jgi:hypothetical protein
VDKVSLHFTFSQGQIIRIKEKPPFGAAVQRNPTAYGWQPPPADSFDR